MRSFIPLVPILSVLTAHGGREIERWREREGGGVERGKKEKESEGLREEGASYGDCGLCSVTIPLLLRARRNKETNSNYMKVSKQKELRRQYEKMGSKGPMKEQKEWKRSHKGSDCIYVHVRAE